VIAVVGEALFDAHLDGEGLRLFPGGGPFNTAVALARLGNRVCYLGAVSRATDSGGVSWPRWSPPVSTPASR
jgi:sugar/nucleoside kinase (ribokinase family)